MRDGFRRNKSVRNDTAEEPALASNAKACGRFARQGFVGNDVRVAELAIELAFAGVGNALDFGDALGNFLNCHALMLTAQILPRLISPSLCFRIRLFQLERHRRQDGVCSAIMSCFLARELCPGFTTADVVETQVETARHYAPNVAWPFG